MEPIQISETKGALLSTKAQSCTKYERERKSSCLYFSKEVGRRERNPGSKAIIIIMKFLFFSARKFNWLGLDYKTYSEQEM